MTAPLDHAKVILREQVRARLKNVPTAERAAASAQLCARAAQEKFFAEAKSILFFAPLPDEPEVWPWLAAALAAGQSVALPRFAAGSGRYEAGLVRDWSELRVGKFGVREPAPGCPLIPLNQLDLALVPGVAFDLEGRRLGRGKGFYDRLLKEVLGHKCGVAFDTQCVAEVPEEPHDMRLDSILTPTRWHRCPRAA